MAEYRTLANETLATDGVETVLTVKDGSVVRITDENFAKQIHPSFESRGDTPTRAGFFKDDDPDTVIHRIRDRVLIADAVEYTGNRQGTNGYGTDWLSANAHSYPIKNSQVAILGDETEGRYALLVAARGGGIGLFAEILNESGAAGRAIYAEAKHKGTAFASSAIEVAAANYTTTDTVPSPYSMAGVRGLFLGAFDGAGDTVGDDNTPAGLTTYGPAAAIDVAGNPTAVAARWNKGLIFRDSALRRDIDGLTGKANAIEMAQQHQIKWWASHTIAGATLRSDVTALSGQDVGIYFSNNAIKLAGTDEAAVLLLTHVTDGVNYVEVRDAVAGASAQIAALGSDTNVSLDFVAKGTGSFNFGDTTAASRLRIDPGSSSLSLLAFGTDTDISVSHYTKGSGVFVFAKNGGTSELRIAPSGSSVVTLSGAGSDTNVDILLSPKGSGLVRFGTHASSSDVAITGYISVKDAGGTTRKLAIIA